MKDYRVSELLRALREIEALNIDSEMCSSRPVEHRYPYLLGVAQGLAGCAIRYPKLATTKNGSGKA